MTYKEAAIRLTLLLNDARAYGVPDVEEYAEAVVLATAALNEQDPEWWGK